MKQARHAARDANADGQGETEPVSRCSKNDAFAISARRRFPKREPPSINIYAHARCFSRTDLIRVADIEERWPRL